MSEQWIYRFGPFELDSGAGLLRWQGEPCQLPPQPMRLLELLVSRAGLLVTRDEARAHLWGDRVVDHNQGLNFSIRRIRAALGDSAAESQYIETVPGRGYRFVATVEKEPRTAFGPNVTPPSLDAPAATPQPVSSESATAWPRRIAIFAVVLMLWIGMWGIRQMANRDSFEVWVLQAQAASSESGASQSSDVARAISERLQRGLQSADGVTAHLGPPPDEASEPESLTSFAEVRSFVLETQFRRQGEQVEVHARLLAVNEAEPFWTSDITAAPEELVVIDREIVNDLVDTFRRLREGTLPDHEVITRRR